MLVILGLIIIVVGVLGLLAVIKIGLTVGVILCVAGLLLVFFGRDTFVRRGGPPV